METVLDLSEEMEVDLSKNMEVKEDIAFNLYLPVNIDIIVTSVQQKSSLQSLHLILMNLLINIDVSIVQPN
jgi:hypothetical protein